MLTRLFWLLVLATALLLGGAAGAHLRAQGLTHRATELRVQSEKAADAFAGTFDGTHQEQELDLMDQRRALLLEASAWRRGTLLCLLLSVLSLFAAWVARELRAVREAIDLEAPSHPEA